MLVSFHTEQLLGITSLVLVCHGLATGLAHADNSHNAIAPDCSLAGYATLGGGTTGGAGGKTNIVSTVTEFCAATSTVDPLNILVSGLLTHGRISTADAEGKIRCYVGEGELTIDVLKTFGNRAVAKVLQLRKRMHHVCNNGFEHHAVMAQSHSAEILAEAFGHYLGWEVYMHGV